MTVATSRGSGSARRSAAWSSSRAVISLKLRLPESGRPSRVEIGADQLLGALGGEPGEACGKRRGRAVAVRALALGEPREQRVEHRRPPEMVPQLEPPAFGQRQRIEQRIEQRDVAEAQTEILQPGAAHGLDREQHDLDIGAFLVGLAEALDAGLAELARVGLIVALRLEAEGGAVIAIARRLIGRSGGARDKAATPARSGRAAGRARRRRGR